MSKRRAHYAVRIADAICEKIALGNSLKQALELVGPLAPCMPVFWRWLNEYPEFREKYDRARMMQGDIHADQMLEMAQEAVNNPSKAAAIRVASDILKWQAEIRDPKKYGSKVQHEITKPPMSPDALKKEIAALEAELGVKAVPGMNTAPNFVRKREPEPEAATNDTAPSGEPAPAPNPEPEEPEAGHGLLHVGFEAPGTLQ